MWPVRATYFCTSYSLALSISASGFSWPSTTRVCSAAYSSPKLIEVGAAPSAVNIVTQSWLPGTRILRPLRSAGALTGLAEVVMLR